MAGLLGNEISAFRQELFYRIGRLEVVNIEFDAKFCQGVGFFFTLDEGLIFFTHDERSLRDMN
jgi:hypothetical protein